METLYAELVKLGITGIFISYLMYLLVQRDRTISSLLVEMGKVQERRAEERNKNAEAMLEHAVASRALAESVSNLTTETIELTATTKASVATAIETIAAATRAMHPGGRVR